MPDEREYLVHLDTTTTMKSFVTVDLDEVREWMAEDGSCGHDVVDFDHIAEFLQSGREDVYGPIVANSYDDESRNDYHNLRIIGEVQ